MHQTCKTCAQPFEITSEDERFYKLFDVPQQKRCPQCRLQRRLMERNTRNLYKRKCDFSGEEMITTYHDKHPFPVYHYKVWWSDKWDAEDYAMDYDPSRTFFEQFQELEQKVPHMSAYVMGQTLENSEYVNCAGYLKNCYLVFAADYDENCYYSNRIYHSLTCSDCLNVYKCELCYETSDCQNCYNLKYSNDCENCIDSQFLSNCKSCKDCLACTNLRHKRYCLFNKQLSKEEFEEEKTKLKLDTKEGVETLRKKADEFFKTQPYRNLQQEHNENCVGDYLYNSKDAYYCFECKDLEDCRYCTRVALTVKNSMDYTAWGDGSEMMYDCAACGDHSYNLKFCSNCLTNCSDLEYCFQCATSSHCFGCVGLKRKKFCILNKQYSEKEYKDLVEKIKKSMGEDYGEFFPLETANYAYNESIAIELFPKPKSQVLEEGYNWLETDKEKPPTPDSISCDSCKKHFRMTEPELKFYKQTETPHPKTCPNCRHFKRMDRRNPKYFWDIKCDKCNKPTKTTHDPDKNLTIYCETCYAKEL
jgi:hypothetical protein